MALSDLIIFVNGQKYILHNPDPETTLLHFLRTDLHLTGTKLACGEGGCGACTVMISYSFSDSDEVHHYNANSCLVPLCSLHGMAVTTVEGIGSLDTRLHPVQERIASAHGTQCGFCTPGFVMSMYSLLRNKPKPSAAEIEKAFDGNLCRCTGYRPILDGYKSFANMCGMGENCCKNKANQNDDLLQNGASEVNGQHENGFHKVNDEVSTCLYDPTQELIFPPYLKLNGKQLHQQSLQFVSERTTWYRPTSLLELLQLKKDNPNCKIIIGNTEIGMETKFKKQLYPVLVAATHIKELMIVEKVNDGIKFGSSVTLATVNKTLEDVIRHEPETRTRVFSAIVEMLRWFGSGQIRNVASIGGNIMTASPVSDLNPLLLACGATLELVAIDGSRRTVAMDSTFFKSYRHTAVLPTEILTSILIPFTTQNEYFHGYKQAMRKEEDVSIVSAGMRVVLDCQAKVTDLSLAFGGVAATTVLATSTMKQLIGHLWDEALLYHACELLTSDLPLHPGSPGGVEEYRSTLTVSFFFKFYLSVLRRLKEQGLARDVPFSLTDVLATQPLERHPVESFRCYESLQDSQSPDDSLRQPLVHESAYKQATGEAIFVDDIPSRYGELHLAFVVSSKARAKLLKVDPTAALTMPGVVDFVSHVDVQGSNIWGIGKDETVFATTEVQHQGQIIGAILADSRIHAQRAAQVVVIQYEELKPIITIAEAIANDSFFPYTPSLGRGNVDVAFSEAENVFEGELHVEAQEHFYLETHVTVAYPGEDSEMEVYSSTQLLSGLQLELASVLGLPANKITCRAKRVGGAFGGKETRSFVVALPVAVAALKHKRPVRCSLNRDEDMMMSSTRHPFLAKYKVGFSSTGKLQALDVSYHINAGFSKDLSYSVLDRALIDSDLCYNIPNLHAHGRVCKTNLPSNTAFRGFGSPQTVAVVESALANVAAYLNIEPEKLRELNFYKEGDITHCNMVLEQCNIQKCWNDCIQQSQFEQRRQQVNLFNSENRWRKRGIAMVPIKFGLGYFERCLNQAGALVNIYLDGTVLVSIGGVEIGQGLHTKVLQVASRELQLPVTKIRIYETATSAVPNATSTAGSLSSDMYGAAVSAACKTLQKRFAPIQALHPKFTWEELIKESYTQQVNLSAIGHFSNPDVGFSVENKSGRPYAYYCFGAACSEVEIDCLTGDHQVLRTDIVMDVGKSLNPAIDIGQIEGAFMQGYGLMVLEQYKVQPDGTLLTRGPGTYKIPSVGNIPQKFNVTLMRESGNPGTSIYSSKGVGEPPLLLASSVLFAIRDCIKAARADMGLDSFFRLDTPATPVRIRMACSDHFTQMFKDLGKSSNVPPWFVDL